MFYVVLGMAGALAAAPDALGSVEVCSDVSGPFRSELLTGADCPGGAELCTEGFLGGKLASEYRMTFLGMTPTTSPTVFTYTGTSTLSLRTGEVIYTEDTGVLVADPASGTRFTTTASIVTGTSFFAESSGTLTAGGEVNPATGLTEGTYSGTICVLCSAAQVNDAGNRLCH